MRRKSRKSNLVQENIQSRIIARRGERQSVVDQSSSKCDHPCFRESTIIFAREVLIIDKPLIRALRNSYFHAEIQLRSTNYTDFHQLYEMRSAKYSGINKAKLALKQSSQKRSARRAYKVSAPAECRPPPFLDREKTQREQQPALLSQTRLVCRRFANLLTGAECVAVSRSSR